MISFEVSAIDIILVIAVFVLLILYMTKLSEKSPEKTSFLPQVTKGAQQERFVSRPQTDYTESPPASRPRTDYNECPRGFGNIRKLGEDNSVSERCLGCYEIMECYSENE